MTPIKTDQTNCIYTAEGCDDLPVTKGAETLTSVWQPTDEERDIIAQGGVIVLTIYDQDHSPVALSAGRLKT